MALCVIIASHIIGYSAEALLLELQLLDSTTRIPGRTLTGVEKRYRTQWVVAMHAVMQHVSIVLTLLFWRFWVGFVWWM